MKQKKQHFKDKTLSLKLVSSIRKVVGMALKQAVIKRKIAFNPNSFTEPIGKIDPEIEYLTPEEIADFLDKISNVFWYPAFVTTLGTGLRVGELAALQRSDFDFEKGFVKVCRNAVKTLFRQQDEIRGNVVELHKEYFAFCWPDGAMVKPEYLSQHFKALFTFIAYYLVLCLDLANS